MPETKPRTRKTTHKLSPADYIRKHSPIKNGLKIKDEDKPLEMYTKILPKLYLGNYQAAKNAEFFKDKKIKAVLNCSKDLPNTFACKKDVEYMRIPIDDSLKEIDIKKCYEFMPVIVEFIHKHTVLQKNNILVHCYAGRQRSAISVAVYLVAKYGMTPADACKYIMDRRKEAFHFGLSLNFEDSLNKYYKDLQKSKRK
jgi:protein-tyrosine phosphatase